LSTEYIHFTANSIDRRQLRIHAAGSICKIFSAAIATSAKDANPGSESRNLKLDINVTSF
jgi:hypothetical protein